MAQCSNGHESTWEDYCSECGVSMAPGQAAPAASAPAATPQESAASPVASPAALPGQPTCSNCSEPYHPDDAFCENCGYDFLSGTLPTPDAAVANPAATSTPATAPDGSPDGPTITPTAAVIRFSAKHMTRMVSDELAYEGDQNYEARIVLTGSKVLIGRGSRSRAIFPEIDLTGHTEDPAVSSRHCMLVHLDDGSWTVNDLGSTNGTYLGEATDLLQAGVETAIDFGTPIYVGAWTSITLEAPPAG